MHISVAVLVGMSFMRVWIVRFQKAMCSSWRLTSTHWWRLYMVLITGES